MKWIPVEKARQLEIDKPVFVKADNDFYGYGKLIKEEKTKVGIVRTFELAMFSEDVLKVNNPVLSTDITHVAIP